MSTLTADIETVATSQVRQGHYHTTSEAKIAMMSKLAEDELDRNLAKGMEDYENSFYTKS
jgi:hypothetical protein